MPNSLDRVSNLSELSTFVDELKVKKIGFLGGRRFSKGDEDFSLNDIIRKFEILKKDDGQTAREIRKQIKIIDKASTVKLEEANFITRFFTYVRSFLNPIHKSKTQDEVLREIGKMLPPNEKNEYLFEQLFDEKVKVGLIPFEEDQQSVLENLRMDILDCVDGRPVKSKLLERMNQLLDDFEENGKWVISSLLYNLETDKDLESLKPHYIITLSAYAKCRPDNWKKFELRDFKTNKTAKISPEIIEEVRKAA